MTAAGPGAWALGRPGRTCLAAVLTCVLALGLAVVTAPPAQAAVTVGAKFAGRGTVDAYVKSSGTRTSSRSGTRRAPAPPRLQYVTLLDCEPNSPAGAPATQCPGMATGCTADQIRVRVFEAPLGTPFSGAWTATPSRCIPRDGARLGEVVIPQLTGAELRKFPLPAGVCTVEPGNGYALVAMPTNIYAGSAEPTTIRTRVLGLELVIRATPVAFAWDYGDGTSFGPSANPGGPYPELSTAHVYRRPGEYEVVMTTTYEAEFSVNGGAFQPVPGDTTVTSPPVQIEVLAGRARLRAEASG